MKKLILILMVIVFCSCVSTRYPINTKAKMKAQLKIRNKRIYGHKIVWHNNDVYWIKRFGNKK